MIKLSGFGYERKNDALWLRNWESSNTRRLYLLLFHIQYYFYWILSRQHTHAHMKAKAHKNCFCHLWAAKTAIRKTLGKMFKRPFCFRFYAFLLAIKRKKAPSPSAKVGGGKFEIDVLKYTFLMGHSSNQSTTVLSAQFHFNFSN